MDALAPSPTLNRPPSVADLQERWQVSRPVLYRMMRSGELDSFTVGRQRRFTVESVLRIESGQPS